MSTPAFLDADRPDVPDLVVPGGVTPFHLPQRPVRGRLVRLGTLADALLARHKHRPPVSRLAGQALALVAAFGSGLKVRGGFSLQAKGDGPVSPLLADCTEAGALRCYAAADAERLDRLLADTPEPHAADLLGAGYLAFTADQGPAQERYQGIVAIEGDDLAAMALHYFGASEQLPCAIHLACAHTAEGWRAAALWLERIADSEADPDPAHDDAWQTATTLAATVTDAELLDDALPADTLLWRLFGAEGISLGLPRALAFGCRCSRQRLAGILEGFPTDDLDHMAVDGTIVMTCEFCNHDFRFDRREVRGKVAAGHSEES